MTSSIYTRNEIYNKYLTIEEIKKHPEITPAVKGDKKLILDILTKQKPRMININGVNNQNKLKFASKLNAFHNIFFEYYKKIRTSKDKIDDVNTLSQENKTFSENYKNSNKNNQEEFNDIKLEYEKRNYYLSPFKEKKNLFNGNILLSNKDQLKNYILYDLGTTSSDTKSLSFLYKINKNLGDKTSEKQLKSINTIELPSIGKDNTKKGKKNEIRKAQKDIKRIQETINSINNNTFSDLDNRDNLGSRGSSAKISTRVNSACFENVKFQNNVNNITNIQIKEKEKKIENNKGAINNIKKIRKKINHISRTGRKEKLNIDNVINNRINHNKHSKFYIKTIDNNDLLKSPLERLYDKISPKENLLNYQSDINNYLKKRKYDLSININPSSICNNFERTRNKVCKSVFLKQDMQLRKQIGGNILFAEKINNNDLKTKNKINNVEENIIKIFCDINNPRNKIH